MKNMFLSDNGLSVQKLLLHVVFNYEHFYRLIPFVFIIQFWRNAMCNGNMSINFNMIVETTFYALGLHFYVERKFKTIYFGHFSPASKRKSNSANYFNRLLLLRGKSHTHTVHRISPASVVPGYLFV